MTHIQKACFVFLVMYTIYTHWYVMLTLGYEKSFQIIKNTLRNLVWEPKRRQKNHLIFLANFT